MKSALSKLIFILLFVLIAWGTLVFFVFKQMNKPSFYEVSEHTNILIIGNSQSEHGIDDAIIPNAINLSQSGDCSFYNYYKGKKMLEENQQINTVIFLYTNNMFLVGMDEWIYDEKHLGYKYPKYAQCIEMSGQLLLLRKNPSAYFIAVRDAARTDLQLLLSANQKSLYKRLDWGSFKTLDVIGDLNAKDDNFDKFYADTSASVLDILYVEKFYSYCKANDVNLILVRTPFHESFPKVNETELQNFHQESLTGAPFYDYLDSTFYDYEFKDVQHLNRTGSDRLSRMLLERMVKDNFIKID